MRYNFDMAKKKKKKRYVIKSPVHFLVMIGFFTVLALFAVILLLSCTCRGGDEPGSNEETLALSAAPTPAPTTVPTATPEPTWESLRLAAIERYVRDYGNCADEAAIRARLATMAIDPAQKMVAFTFDDGPRNEITDLVLDVCEQYGVRATFFIKGDNIATHEEQLMRMLSLGCEIGNHTWMHTNVEELTASEMREEIGKVNDAIYDRFGYTIKLFRPPYIKYGDKGSETRNTLIALMNEWDMAVINHTRSTHDTYDKYTADMIYQRGVQETDELGKGLDGSIILCHDKQKKTADAFARIVPELLSRGYQFVTVSELLHYSEDGFHAGWIYSSAK